MTLNPGDLMFIGFDTDNDDVAFIATTDIAAGEIIYFTDDGWDGTGFGGSGQIFEYTVPVGGIPICTVVEIDMDPAANSVTFSNGGAVDYIQGGHNLAGKDEMLWAFQGTRSGDDVTPTNFVAVIGNEADGNYLRTPELSGTGLTTTNGAIIHNGDEDYLEYTDDAVLPNPVTQAALIASISDTSNWATADGSGNSNPNGSFFDYNFPAVACFTTGTLIETATGLRPIDELQTGDLVATRDNGFQPLRWIGRQKVAAQGTAAPVVFATGAIGNTRPLAVSPQHRMMVTGWRAELLFFMDEVLVPAIALINESTIRQRAGGTVEYIHILFDHHEIVMADGVPSESFYPGPVALNALADATRQEVLDLFPSLSCDLPPPHEAARMILTVREGRLLA